MRFSPLGDVTTSRAMNSDTLAWNSHILVSINSTFDMLILFAYKGWIEGFTVLQNVVAYGSTYVLVALTIDRHDAIARPMNFSIGG